MLKSSSSTWAGSADRQLPHVPNSENLRSFTEELGRVVSLTHWQHGECCNALVADGAIAWVLFGTLRKCVFRASGRRRIIDLIMAGEFLTDDAGLFSFEVLTDGTLTGKIARRDFTSLAERQPSLYRFLHVSTCQTIARLEDHILVLGRTRSTQKVASYLILMSRRLSAQCDDGPVVLPVSRYDIADHVGIAVETVSRAISELRRQGVIELETPRHLVVKDLQKLANGAPDSR